MNAHDSHLALAKAALSDTVRDRLQRALTEACGIAPAALHDRAPFAGLLLAVDDVSEIEAVIEAEFGVRVPDFAIDGLRRVGDLVRVITVCLWARGDVAATWPVRRAA